MLAYWHRSSPWSSGKKCGRRERVSVCHGCLLLAVLKRAVVLSHLKVYARVTMLSHFKAHAISIYIYIYSCYSHPGIQHTNNFTSEILEAASGEAKPSLRPAIVHSLAATSILQVGVYNIYLNKYIYI